MKLTEEEQRIMKEQFETIKRRTGLRPWQIRRTDYENDCDSKYILRKKERVEIYVSLIALKYFASQRNIDFYFTHKKKPRGYYHCGKNYYAYLRRRKRIHG